MFRNIISNLVRNKKRSNFVIHKNSLNNLLINNYYVHLFKLYNKYTKNIEITKKHKNVELKQIMINYKLINKHLNKNNNNILYYKKITNKYNKTKLYSSTNNINNNHFIPVNIGLDIKIINKNNILYYFYFNNNTIYKEIVTEYNIRIHNKDNKYDQLFILHRNIIIFTNKKINIGNIKNGIYLSLNCFYSNNNINYISLLYKINKYSKLPIIPIFIYSKKYFTSVYNNKYI